jgi:hypothetical protein
VFHFVGAVVDVVNAIALPPVVNVVTLVAKAISRGKNTFTFTGSIF